MSARLTAVVAVLLAAAVAGGCNLGSKDEPTNPTDDPVSGEPAASAPAPATSGSEDPTASTGGTGSAAPAEGSAATPTAEVSNPPADTGDPISVTGTVVAGTEAGCVLVNGYLLLDGPADVLVPGQEVAVVGTPAPDAVTTCMQGKPLKVVSARTT
jgi:hypothetical protein